MADGKVTIATELDSSGAEKGISKLGGKVKSGLGTAAKVGAGAVAVASAATVGLLKESISQYSEYEQLVGGVDTLFKDSSEQVKKYAKNAYKTAGLSANAYMEQATSFSASLIQSLGGDTAKAAKLTNVAITDMSDNANKMGTSMELIQNAYNGFAKGNFTMLDNLKLGYGGTQTEMVRLINDSGVLDKKIKKISEASFDDMINAIHKVQSNLGIMGTTREEAEKTIQGSIGMMKESWTNLITGMSDETANFDKLIKNFLESVGIVAKNLLPRISIALTEMIKMIEKFLPEVPKLLKKFVPQILEGATDLIQGIVGVLPQIVNTIIDISVNIIPKLVDGIVQAFPKLVKAFIDVVKTISKEIPKILPHIVDAILEITDLLVDQSDELIDAGFELLDALVEGLMKATPKLLEKMPDIIVKMAEKTAENADKIADKADVILEKLADGLVKATPKLIKAAPKILLALAKAMMASLGAFYKVAFVIIKNLWKGLKDNFIQFKDWASTMIPKIKDAFISAMGTIKDVGKNLVEGIWKGISGAGGWLKEKITGFGKGVVNKFKNIFDIHSPSKLFEKVIGRNLALGITVGFEKYNPMSQINNDLKNGISKINATATADLNTSVSSNAMNYMAMADVFVSALEKSGLTVSIGERQFGRIVRSVI